MQSINSHALVRKISHKSSRFAATENLENFQDGEGERFYELERMEQRLSTGICSVSVSSQSFFTFTSQYSK